MAGMNEWPLNLSVSEDRMAQFMHIFARENEYYRHPKYGLPQDYQKRRRRARSSS